jgi:hypothetical protein
MTFLGVAAAGRLLKERGLATYVPDWDETVEL